MAIVLFILLGISFGFSQTEFAYNPLQIDTVIVIQNETNVIKLPEKHRIIDNSINISHKNIDILPPKSHERDQNKTQLRYTLWFDWHFQLPPLLSAQIRQKFSRFAKMAGPFTILPYLVHF